MKKSVKLLLLFVLCFLVLGAVILVASVMYSSSNNLEYLDLADTPKQILGVISLLILGPILLAISHAAKSENNVLLCVFSLILYLLICYGILSTIIQIASYKKDIVQNNMCCTAAYVSAKR